MGQAADFFVSYTSADGPERMDRLAVGGGGYQVVARWRANRLKARGGRLLPAAEMQVDGLIQ